MNFQYPVADGSLFTSVAGLRYSIPLMIAMTSLVGRGVLDGSSNR